MTTNSTRGPRWQRINILELSAEAQQRYSTYQNQPIKNEKEEAANLKMFLDAEWLQQHPERVDGYARSYKVTNSMVHFALRKLTENEKSAPVFHTLADARAAGRVMGHPIVWLEYADGRKIAGYQDRTWVYMPPERKPSEVERQPPRSRIDPDELAHDLEAA